jgi:septation ring formation regulator EzrA
MLLQQLQEKEQFLTERVSRLKSSLQEVEQNLEPENIERKAEEIGNLNTQLFLTEKALQSAQDKLRAQKELEGSKEFRDKLKLAQELRKQAQKETTEVFETLQELEKKTTQVFKKLKQYDKLNRETSGEPQVLLTAQVQPFAWLLMVHKQVKGLLYSTTWLKDKLS